MRNFNGTPGTPEYWAWRRAYQAEHAEIRQAKIDENARKQARRGDRRRRIAALVLIGWAIVAALAAASIAH